MYRKIFSMFSLVLVLAVAFSSFTPAAAQSGGGGLSKHDRELLAEAIVNGKSTVTLLIASTPGSNTKVANGIQKLGGTVRYREDTISYISAIVPVDKAEAAAVLSGVQSVDIDEIIPLDDPLPDGAVAPTRCGSECPGHGHKDLLHARHARSIGK